MVIDEVYEQLKLNDSELTKSKFTREYMDRSRSYWFVCKNKQIDVSDSVLLRLYGNLKGTSELWERCADSSSTKGKNIYEEKSKFNKQLADMVFEEIERRAFA